MFTTQGALEISAAKGIAESYVPGVGFRSELQARGAAEARVAHVEVRRKFSSPSHRTKQFNKIQAGP